MRHDGRTADQLRPLSFQRRYTGAAPGSARTHAERPRSNPLLQGHGGPIPPRMSERVPDASQACSLPTKDVVAVTRTILLAEAVDSTAHPAGASDRPQPGHLDALRATISQRVHSHRGRLRESTARSILAKSALR